MGHEVPSPLFTAEVKSGWSYISAVPVCLHLLVPTSGITVTQCDAQNAKHHVQATGGTRWRSQLRHCAASRKVMGSIADGVIGFFHGCNPGLIMALGLTQPLT